jgi:iron-sulfur cluster repair protein YtfE (RIC family)
METSPGVPGRNPILKECEPMPEAMDAITLLEQDHRKVKELFKEFEGLTDRAKAHKERMYETIRTELEIHTKIEEEIFYPAARRVDEDMIAEAIEEHHIVDRLLKELKSTEAGDEQFDAKMKVLMENVEHHVEEEEGELFPTVRREMKGDRLSELGSEMMERKKELMRRAERAA